MHAIVHTIMGRRDPNSESNRDITKAILANPRAASREIAKICGKRYTKAFPVTVSNIKKALKQSNGAISAESQSVSVEHLSWAREYVSWFEGDWETAIAALHALRDFQV